jgi:hypothetical protein
MTLFVCIEIKSEIKYQNAIIKFIIYNYTFKESFKVARVADPSANVTFCVVLEQFRTLFSIVKQFSYVLNLFFCYLRLSFCVC